MSAGKAFEENESFRMSFYKITKIKACWTIFRNIRIFFMFCHIFYDLQNILMRIRRCVSCFIVSKYSYFLIILQLDLP